MTDDPMSNRPDGKGAPTPKDEVPPEAVPAPEEPVPFVYKAIAFAILALPWSFLLSEMQELLEQYQSGSLGRVALLIGIVAFLLLVGALAKRLHRFHQGMSRS